MADMIKAVGNLDPSVISRRRVLRGAGALLAAAVARGRGMCAAPRPSIQATAVNHISYQSNDYTKVRDFYADLLGLEVSHDDGKQCYLAFANTFLIARNKSSADVKAPLIDHIAYTIDNWDTKTVESALVQLGLNPKADTENSFHVKDPDGFDLQIAGKGMRPAFWPEPPGSPAKRITAPRTSPFKAIGVNHISYQSSDFARTRDFYAQILGMRVFLHTSHTGEKQTWLGFGDGYVIPRTSTRPDMRPPLVDHIAYTIDKWDRSRVEAELKRRGFDPRPDTDESFIIKDCDGFSLQISGVNMKP